jgi:hypothetical protein
MSPRASGLFAGGLLNLRFRAENLGDPFQSAHALHDNTVKPALIIATRASPGRRASQCRAGRHLLWITALPPRV